MKRILLSLISLLLILSFTSCDNYTSSFSAIGLIRSNTTESCKAEFMSLKGRLVFKIKKTDGGEGDIHYTAELEKGNVNVYYDIYGTKEHLFEINAGESKDGRGGYIEAGKTVYIIIEAAENSRGKVHIDLEKSSDT